MHGVPPLGPHILHPGLWGKGRAVLALGWNIAQRAMKLGGQDLPLVGIIAPRGHEIMLQHYLKF